MTSKDVRPEIARAGERDPDPEAVAAALARHSGEPETTPARRIQRLMIGLGQAIAGKRKIYLDTRYWIARAATEDARMSITAFECKVERCDAQAARRSALQRAQGDAI